MNIFLIIIQERVVGRNKVHTDYACKRFQDRLVNQYQAACMFVCVNLQYYGCLHQIKNIHTML